MTTLKESLPIEKLTLPGMGDVNCSGLILIVGPNSAGKSQFLRDIHQRVSGEPRSLVVATEIKLKRLPIEPLMLALNSAGYIEKYEDENGTFQVRPKTTYLGSGQHANQVQLTQLHNWYNTYANNKDVLQKRRDEYLGYFGRFLITALFLEQRLTALNQAGMIDFVNSPPQHDLHALYLNDSARGKLFAEIRASFAKAVWPDISRGTGVCLRVSDQGNIPTADDRLSPTKMHGFRSIESEGDGLKSYVATCVALLLGSRPLCLVDEPEMCLHPPQAYNLGRFIGEFGSTAEGATFVATHSSHILRGVIQKATKLQIIRLTRLGSDFRAHLVPAETLEIAMAKPTVRAESVLDGIFAQAVVVLEADGDRTVYQAVWETLGRETRLDIHFATVGGTGGIADTCALYSALRIPVAVVADLDVLSDSDRLMRVLVSLGATDAVAIVKDARACIEKVRSIPPTMSESDVRAMVAKSVPETLDWRNNDDVALAGELRKIARFIDRMRRLKTPRDQPLPSDIQIALDALIGRLAANGVFVVPVGELEQWLSSCEIEASKKNKWAWANEAASLVRKLGRQPGDVWDFVGRVGDFLQNRFLAYSK